MKRIPRETSNNIDRKTRTTDPRHLTAVRGGRGRENGVPLPAPAFDEQYNHNETLVRY